MGSKLKKKKGSFPENVYIDKNINVIEKVYNFLSCTTLFVIRENKTKETLRMLTSIPRMLTIM